MTISTSTNITTFLGNGAQTVFDFDFIGGDPSYILVTTVSAAGVSTVIPSSAYTLALNPALPGAIWGIGGSVTYPLVGSPLATGATITVERVVPELQVVSLSNQGSLTPQSMEQGLDLLEMQTQQASLAGTYAFTAPVTDATPPLPAPPASVRANQFAVFDGSGNLTAGTALSTGVISTAMQPVVDAATLALGRTAFGLGALATAGYGAGLGVDGSGNARVNRTPVVDTSTQAVIASFAWNLRVATVAVNYNLAGGATLWPGFTFSVDAQGGAATFTPVANDSFAGGSSGASLVVPKGSIATLTTDGATNSTWYVALSPNAGTTSLSPAYGQAHLSITSPTTLLLSPKGGSLVTIAGSAYALPSAGVSSVITNCYLNGVSAQSLSSSTLYYAYLFNNAGVLTIDFSTTGHSTDTTAGNVGVEIKTGDDTRTLIGMVYPTGGSLLLAGANILVLSWFNKSGLSALSYFTTGRTTSSTTFIELNTEIRCNFLIWAGDTAQVATNGWVEAGTSAFLATAVGIDSATVPLDAYTLGLAQTTTYTASACTSLTANGLSEGAHFATLLGLTSAGTATWAGSGSPGSRCALCVGVRG